MHTFMRLHHVMPPVLDKAKKMARTLKTVDLEGLLFSVLVLSRS